MVNNMLLYLRVWKLFLCKKKYNIGCIVYIDGFIKELGMVMEPSKSTESGY